MAAKPRKEETWRLFVACELSAAIKQALTAIQADLKGHADLSGLRWVRPQGIHLTLKFLGATPVGKIAAIQAALHQAVAGLPSFTLSLGKAGSFGDRRGPRVLWVGIVGDIDRLLELQRRVERALVPLGFPAEARPFSPHLTLARVPPPAAARGPRIAAALAAVKTPAAPPMTVTEVSLMRSILGPGGAVYERVAAFPLR